MMETIRRYDRAWARFEGWLTVGVLILMVLVAGFAAGVRNLTRFEIEWASRLLADIDWADSLLRKGTMWLAFLGASLATYHKKHIIIDPLLRIAPPRGKYTMLAISSLVAGLITFTLSYSFGSAVQLNLTERPIEFELLGEDGRSMHVCNATDEQIAQLQDLTKPTIFCAFRFLFDKLGLRAFFAGIFPADETQREGGGNAFLETPGAAFQLIVPIMFFVIALRLMGQGVAYVGVLMGGQAAIDAAEDEERRAIEAQAASFVKEDKPKP